MEGWLILLGVMLPLAPTLQAIERRLGTPAPRRASSVDQARGPQNN
jgi:hypothetical protein